MRSITLSSRAAIASLLLTTSCSLSPGFEKDTSGQPVLTWHAPKQDTSGAPAPEDSEQALRGELRDAQQAGTENTDTVDKLYRLAVLRRQQGDLAEAANLYRQALEICEKEKGPDDPDVAAILNNLAGVEAAQGHYDAALPLLERNLTIRQKTLGDGDVLTAQAMNNLALLYAARGNPIAAEPLYQQAIATLEKSNAPVDELDRVLENYAALLHETGRDKQAEKLETRARLLRATNAPAKTH